MIHKTIKLKSGGQFSYVITDEDLQVNPDGNLIYIFSISYNDKLGSPIRGTHLIERVFKYIDTKLPQIEYMRINVSCKDHIPIFQRSLFKVFNKTIFIDKGPSINIKIK